MAKAGAIEIPITLGGVREVRQQIKSLRGELINATDPKEVARLSENIGELTDKLKDANEKAQVFASGSKFEQASNAFGLMKNQIASLDFEGAGESAALFANRIKSINPTEFGTQIKGLISIVGNLTKSFISMGASLLMNPIFLITAAIVAIVAIVAVLLNKLGFLKPILNAIGEVFKSIGKAIDWVIQKIKDFLDWIGLTNYAEQDAAEKSAKAQEQRANAYEQSSKKRISAIDQSIRMEQLDGKNTTDMEVKKQELIRQTARERVKALQARYKSMVLSGDYDKEEIKKLKEELSTQRETIKSSTNEIAYIKKKARVDEQKEQDEANKKALEKQNESNKKAIDNAKKYKDDRIAVEREVQNLIIGSMANGEEKERAEINEKYKRAIEDAKRNEKYLKDERTKIIGLLQKEQQRELNAIDDKKHQEDLERKRQQQIELAKVESETRASLIEQLTAIEDQVATAGQDAQTKEENAVRAKYFTMIEQAKQYGMDASAVEEQQQSEIDAIKQKYADIEEQRQKDLNAKKLEAVKGGLSAIGNLAEAWAGKDKARQEKAFKIQKAANIATATIDTYKGAATAFVNAGNPILGAVFAASVIAAGIANIAKIKQTEFNGGGGSPSSSTSSTATATPQSLAPSFSFQGSGNNANNLDSKNDLSMITVKAVVSESEVTSTQQQVSKYENSAKL